MVSPYTLFFPQKSDDLFSHRPLESHDLFSYRLVTTATLSAFQRRLSSVLCKLPPPHYFYSGVTRE